MGIATVIAVDLVGITVTEEAGVAILSITGGDDKKGITGMKDWTPLVCVICAMVMTTK
jgi:ribosomal protein S6E (S10)